jgi:hypothetical protein
MASAEAPLEVPDEAPVKRGHVGTTYFENQDEAFCGIHAINMLFQERKVVWFPGCPLYIRADRLDSVDLAYEAWTMARDIEDHDYAQYDKAAREIVKPIKSANAAEKKLLDAAFLKVRRADQVFQGLIAQTDEDENDVKMAALAYDATPETIAAWAAVDSASEAKDMARLEAAETELEAATAAAPSATAAYEVTVAQRNVWRCRYVLSRRRTSRARFEITQVATSADAAAPDALNPAVLFNVASYCSGSWARDQKEIQIRISVQDEAERVVRFHTRAPPDEADESYPAFMANVVKYAAAGVNTRDVASVRQYMVEDALEQPDLVLEEDMCTINEDGSDGNLPALLIEHIMWPQFKYQVIPIPCAHLPQVEWSATVRDHLQWGGILGLIVNYDHPQVKNHYCAVIKFPNPPDPAAPYAIGDSIFVLFPPQTVITYYTLEGIMDRLLGMNIKHISSIFAQVPTRAITEAVSRMIAAGADVDPDPPAADEAAAEQEEANENENANMAAAIAASLEPPTKGGSRKTRRASKARRNKSSRR